MMSIESGATYKVEHTNGKSIEISGAMLKAIIKDDGGKYIAGFTKVNKPRKA